MSKKTLKKKSFADIAKLRKNMEIKDGDETLFTLYELSSVDFSQLLQMYYEIKDAEELQKKIVIFVLRKGFESDVYTLDDLSDEEIVKATESFGAEIIEKINEAIDVLVTQKVTNYFNRITKQLKEAQKLNEELQGESEQDVSPAV